MLEKLKSYFDIGHDLYGLEIFNDENIEFYKLIRVKKVKQELVIINEQLLTNREELIQNLDKKIPVCLAINSTKVLDKLIIKKSDASQMNLVESTFPSLDFERFYFNNTQFQESQYLAIIEKIYADKMLKEFENENIFVISFQLGLSTLSTLLPYIKEKSIQTNSKKILFSEAGSEITAKVNQKEDQIHSINDMDINSSALIGFGSVLNIFIEPKTISSNYEEVEEKLAKEFKYTRNFQVLLWPIIISFLALLMINFFSFNFYFNALEKLNQNVNNNEITKSRFLTLKNKVLKKEKRVTSILSNKNSSATYYLDNIIINMPLSIILTEITYQPIAQPIRREKKIELDNNIFLVKGQTSNAEDFSLWIDKIEDLSWIDLVETIEYTYKSNSLSNFTLKLHVDEK